MTNTTTIREIIRAAPADDAFQRAVQAAYWAGLYAGQAQAARNFQSRVGGIDFGRHKGLQRSVSEAAAVFDAAESQAACNDILGWEVAL